MADEATGPPPGLEALAAVSARPDALRELRRYSLLRCLERPSANGKPRPVDLAAKDREFVAEYKDLQLLRAIAAAEEHDQLEQAADNEVKRGHTQRRPPTDGTPDATAASAVPVRHLIGFLHPTRV
jgi:hypothetical protein